MAEPYTKEDISAMKAQYSVTDEQKRWYATVDALYYQLKIANNRIIDLERQLARIRKKAR